MFEEAEKYSALSVAAGATVRVGSMTHGYYRYPARFGETFVREAISQFSRTGDHILDPFCGGGTTIVEALASGRGALGSDLSPLALFVTRVKSTPLSDSQLKVIENWVRQVSVSTQDLLCPSSESNDSRLMGLRQPYRNLLCSLKRRTTDLPSGQSRDFARCLLLRVGQWAFDGKQHVPTPSEIVGRLWQDFQQMQKGMLDYRCALRASGIGKHDTARNRRLALCRAQDLTSKRLGMPDQRISLVITSPPYLGVHVLYNKWQMGGRRELRSPFYLADCQDIGGASSYTIIDRKAKAHDPYYQAIHATFQSVERLLKPRAYVIQLVSFSDAESALPHYLSALKAAGLDLCETYVRAGSGLKWRAVPGRRWYARVGAVSDSSASQEVLLVHRNRG